ncbi:aromatic ring-hydroxylating dioxygenase subunit alpha [Sphingomonas sp.]|uniref:aromatic ring-hydroxylating oxygenase subunit alpha n=1 Tax=Sphingomonas sp. TaxID=28214 RepID=UPI00286AB08E|nr:aromatic ring-hydroxylating dioxygenase subunit alpha [Sphingomonas sp.]
MDVKRQVRIERVSAKAAGNGTPVDKAPDPDLGHGLIPVERYISRDFMALEWQHVWTKVWLLGGRSDDIPDPGDYICTDIGKESVLIVRQPDGSVKAFHNVCLHRGNRLRPEGIGKGVENFQCMYHHWTYALDGAIEHIPDRSSFPQGCPPQGRIQPLPAGEWGSFVWFSLDPEVEPLEQYLDPLPRHLGPYHFERMRWVRDLTIEWNCNWKASVDAFNESYHVQGIHPQLMWYLDDVNLQIDCYRRHNRYLIPFGTISPRKPLPSQIPPPIMHLMEKAGMDPADWDGPMTGIRKAIQKQMRKSAKKKGRDYSELNDDQMTDDYHYMIFPNVTLNTHADDLMLFRQRPHPTDPDKMYYDIWMFELADAEKDDPAVEYRRPKHQHFTYGDKSIGLVLDQDAFNLPNVQKGMHSSAFEGLWLGEQELRIRHFHKVVDDYLAKGDVA